MSWTVTSLLLWLLVWGVEPVVTHQTSWLESTGASLQDAQGQNLCHYREFEPSEAGDSDNDDTDWHAQKKGCCTIM